MVSKLCDSNLEIKSDEIFAPRLLKKKRIRRVKNIDRNVRPTISTTAAIEITTACILSEIFDIYKNSRALSSPSCGLSG
jgi:hypothetical protein